MIKSKQPACCQKKVVLIHDNAQPHTAELIATLITSLKWDTFPHPAYCQDFASSDFWAFPGLKEFLGGKCF